MDKTDKIYHQPSHLWKGQKAIKKLKELSKEKPIQLSNGCRDKHSGKCIYQLQSELIGHIMK